jgi:hypothetical protein
VTATGDLEPALPEKCLPLTYSAHGVVKSARSGLALDNIEVSLEGTEISAMTKSGYFTLEKVPPGKYNAKFESAGYITVERELTVSKNINVGGVMDVLLSPTMLSDQWRAVVKWNEKPTDLDAYALWGYSKVCLSPPPTRREHYRYA